MAGRLDELIPANKDVYQLKKMALEGLGRYEEARDADNSMKIFSQEEEREALAEEE